MSAASAASARDDDGPDQPMMSASATAPLAGARGSGGVEAKPAADPREGGQKRGADHDYPHETGAGPPAVKKAKTSGRVQEAIDVFREKVKTFVDGGNQPVEDEEAVRASAGNLLAVAGAMISLCVALLENGAGGEVLDRSFSNLADLVPRKKTWLMSNDEWDDVTMNINRDLRKAIREQIIYPLRGVRERKQEKELLVFWSHSGSLKGLVFQAFERVCGRLTENEMLMQGPPISREEMFFDRDEKSLGWGEKSTDLKMMSDASACRYGQAVLSADVFLNKDKPWPMAELLIFCARLDDPDDHAFLLLALAYPPGGVEEVMWRDFVLALPIAARWPTIGDLREEFMTQKAGELAKRVIDRVQSQDLDWGGKQPFPPLSILWPEIGLDKFKGARDDQGTPTVFAQIKDFFFPDLQREEPQGIRTVLLRGGIGTGKSTTAAEFAVCHSSQFPDGVFWVDCGSPEKMDKSLRDVAFQEYGMHKADQEMSDEEVRSVIRTWFEKCKAGKWLLILDNFRGASRQRRVFDEILPKQQHVRGSVLITSRETRLGFLDAVDTVDLDTEDHFTENDAVGLLLDGTKCVFAELSRDEQDCVEELVGKIGAKNPLLLVAARNHIQTLIPADMGTQSSRFFAEYLKTFDSEVMQVVLGGSEEEDDRVQLRDFIDDFKGENSAKTYEIVGAFLGAGVKKPSDISDLDIGDLVTKPECLSPVIFNRLKRKAESWAPVSRNEFMGRSLIRQSLNSLDQSSSAWRLLEACAYVQRHDNRVCFFPKTLPDVLGLENGGAQWEILSSLGVIQHNQAGFSMPAIFADVVRRHESYGASPKEVRNAVAEGMRQCDPFGFWMNADFADAAASIDVEEWQRWQAIGEWLLDISDSMAEADTRNFAAINSIRYSLGVFWFGTGNWQGALKYLEKVNPGDLSEERDQTRTEYSLLAAQLRRFGHHSVQEDTLRRIEHLHERCVELFGEFSLEVVRVQCLHVLALGVSAEAANQVLEKLEAAEKSAGRIQIERTGQLAMCDVLAAKSHYIAAFQRHNGTGAGNPVFSSESASEPAAEEPKEAPKDSSFSSSPSSSASFFDQTSVLETALKVVELSTDLHGKLHMQTLQSRYQLIRKMTFCMPRRAADECQALIQTLDEARLEIAHPLRLKVERARLQALACTPNLDPMIKSRLISRETWSLLEKFEEAFGAGAFETLSVRNLVVYAHLWTGCKDRPDELLALAEKIERDSANDFKLWARLDVILVKMLVGVCKDREAYLELQKWLGTEDFKDELNLNLRFKLESILADLRWKLFDSLPDRASQLETGKLLCKEAKKRLGADSHRYWAIAVELARRMSFFGQGADAKELIREVADDIERARGAAETAYAIWYQAYFGEPLTQLEDPTSLQEKVVRMGETLGITFKRSSEL